MEPVRLLVRRVAASVSHKSRGRTGWSTRRSRMRRGNSQPGRLFLSETAGEGAFGAAERRFPDRRDRAFGTVPFDAAFCRGMRNHLAMTFAATALLATGPAPARDD